MPHTHNKQLINHNLLYPNLFWRPTTHRRLDIARVLVQ